MDVLDRDRLTTLVSGPDPDEPDLDVALALMDLVRDDLQLSGTSGDHKLVDAEIRLAIRALQRSTSVTEPPLGGVLMPSLRPQGSLTDRLDAQATGDIPAPNQLTPYLHRTCLGTR